MNGRVSITFNPQRVSVSVPAGSTLLEAALLAGVQVDSICGGKGKCGKCRVKIISGDTRCLTEREKDLLPSGEIEEDLRLACQTKVEEGMEVMVTQEPGDQGLRGKEINRAVFTDFITRVKKRYLKLNPRSGQDQTSDWERIREALPDLEQPGLKGLKEIAALMRQAEFKGTVTSLDKEFLNIEAGDTEHKNYGLAVDLGTTTVAVYLGDLPSGRIVDSGAALNKQSFFGADVVSRMSYVGQHPEGLAVLQKAATKTINELLDHLLSKQLIDRQNIYLTTVVGNPTMMHLFLGINPRGLAEFPFTPVFSNSVTVAAVDVGLKLSSQAKLEILPLVSAYVGADMVAAALAAGLDEPGPPRLLLDIGTNGEVALAVNGKIWACSTAAGPALEGGAIKFGMRAVPGAISAVNITDDVELSIIGHKSALGLCGSGLLDAVAQMLGRGLLNKTGRLKDPGSLPEGLPAAIRKRLAPGEKGQVFHLAPKVYLTQSDINQLQLAKGAMRAGIEILMAEAGIVFNDLEEIMLAGAFGASLRPESLITIGLLPPVPVEKVRAIGNAAGVGAFLCLLSEERHQKAMMLARHINYLELSLKKEFQKRFMEGIKFEIKE